MRPKPGEVNGQIHSSLVRADRVLAIVPLGEVQKFWPSAFDIRSHQHDDSGRRKRGCKIRPDRPDKIRAQRSSNLKQLRGKDLVEYIDSEKHFSFWPYEYTPRGTTEVRLYANAGGSLVDLAMRGIPAGFAAWLAIIAPTLLPFITESKTGVLSYNPPTGDETAGV